MDFYEFGTEVTEQDRATVAYYIKREFGDSLFTLDNYGLCKAMCSIQENAGGVYMRAWDARNEEDETPALQRLYAYGIKNAKNRNDFIHFLVGYAERAPYDEERVIGEYLIRECSDELDDNLKYKAFEYAIYGILETIDIDDIIREQKETILSYTKANKTLKKSLSTAESELSKAKANISSLTAQNASLQHNVMELNAVKVGQRIRANLKEGKITRWEVKSSQSSCVRASGDELIVVGPGAVYVWGYIDRTPKLFNITAVRK